MLMDNMIRNKLRVNPRSLKVDRRIRKTNKLKYVHNIHKKLQVNLKRILNL
jgi:hypothetical protein